MLLGQRHSEHLEGYLRGEREAAQLMPLAQQGLHLLPAPGSNLLIEQKIEFTHADLPSHVSFRGYIDYVDLNDPTQVMVMDHKTRKKSSYAPTHEELRTDVQLAVYCHWVRHCTEYAAQTETLRTGHITYLKDGTKGAFVRVVEMPDSLIASNMEDILSTVREMAAFKYEQDQSRLDYNREACWDYAGCPHRMYCILPSTQSTTKESPMSVFGNSSSSSSGDGLAALRAAGILPSSDSQPEALTAEPDQIIPPDAPEVLPPEIADPETSTEETDAALTLPPAPPSQEDSADVALSDLNLPSRVLRACEIEGYQYRSDVEGFTAADFAALTGVGPKSAETAVEIIGARIPVPKSDPPIEEKAPDEQEEISFPAEPVMATGKVDIHTFIQCVPRGAYSREVVYLSELLRPLQVELSRQLGGYYALVPYQEGHIQVAGQFEQTLPTLLGKTVIVDSVSSSTKHCVEILLAVSSFTVSRV